jgi:lipopolysaccharide assembly outer membrane protein LptD (OstA)
MSMWQLPRSLWALAICGFMLGAPVGWAAPPRPSDLPFSVTADSFDYEEERDLYTANGNVKVVQEGGGTLTADWVVINYTTRIGVAVGNVVIKDSGNRVTTEFARVNFETLEVLARDGKIDSEDPALVVEGDWLARTGENTYDLQNGLFTTCRCPPSRGRRPWEITVSDADVTVGRYAVAKNMVFKTLGVPILYSPFAVFPVKSERESGFLVPTFGRSSRGGTELGLPFFWAARENLNITLTPQLLTKRGFKTNGDIEYVFGETGYGEGGFGLLLDDDEVRDGDPATRFSNDRYAFFLRHEQPLGFGSRFGLDLKRISDNQYIVDFQDFSSNERSARFLESSAWFAKSRSGVYANAEVSFQDDLQSPNDLDRDDQFLQRLPDVRLSLLPRRIGLGPFELGTDVRYTYFYQKDQDSALRGNSAIRGQFFDTGPDGLFDADEPDANGAFPGGDVNGDNGGGRRAGEGDGIFQEGELLADRGHRLDFYPKLSLPQRFGFIETISEIGSRQTFYVADEDGSSTRSLVTGRVDARTRLQRAFQVGRIRLLHRVEPRVGLAFVSGNRQDRKPLFIPGSFVRSERLIDADPRLLLRDPSDRIDDERFLNYAVANEIYAPSLDPGKPPREVASFRVGSGYDFDEGEQTNLFLDASFFPNPNFSVSSEVGYDTRDSRIDEIATSVFVQGAVPPGLPRSQLPRLNQAIVSYRFLRDGIDPFERFARDDEVFEDFSSDFSRVDQITVGANYILSSRFDLFASGYQSFDDSEVRGGGFGVNFFSRCGCWEMTLRFDSMTRPDDTRIALEVRLEGFGIGVKRDIDNQKKN